jgi:hypothetical protein
MFSTVWPQEHYASAVEKANGESARFFGPALLPMRHFLRHSIQTGFSHPRFTTVSAWGSNKGGVFTYA